MNKHTLQIRYIWSRVHNVLSNIYLETAFTSGYERAGDCGLFTRRLSLTGFVWFSVDTYYFFKRPKMRNGFGFRLDFQGRS